MSETNTLKTEQISMRLTPEEKALVDTFTAYMCFRMKKHLKPADVFINLIYSSPEKIRMDEIRF